MPEINKQQYRSIPFRTIFYMSWKNLGSKKLRSFLTLAGMVIGVSAIYFLISLGLGLRTIVTKDVLGNQSVQVVDVLSPNSKVLKLDSKVRERIKNLPHVQTTSVSFSFPGALRMNNSEIDGIVYGIEPSYQSLTSLSLIKGSLLKNTDSKAIVVSRAALRSMGINDDQSAIGQTIEIDVPLKNTGAGNKSYKNVYKITGIVDSSAGNEVFVLKEPFELAGVTFYSEMKVAADTKGYVPSVRSKIESLGFQTSSPLDTIDQINQIFKYFNLLLVGLGAIGMLIAILGMFNTLTISLLERTKEIGLMVALGARHKDMRRLFICEAIILSLIGGFIGILVASAIGRSVNMLINVLANRRGVVESFELFSSPFWLSVGTIGFMLLLGLIIVYFPAKRAERISPIDALRHE